MSPRSPSLDQGLDALGVGEECPKVLAQYAHVVDRCDPAVPRHEPFDVEGLELIQDLDPAVGVAGAHPRVHLHDEQVAQDGDAPVGQDEESVALGVAAAAGDQPAGGGELEPILESRVGARSSTSAIVAAIWRMPSARASKD